MGIYAGPEMPAPLGIALAVLRLSLVIAKVTDTSTATSQTVTVVELVCGHQGAGLLRRPLLPPVKSVAAFRQSVRESAVSRQPSHWRIDFFVPEQSCCEGTGEISVDDHRRCVGSGRVMPLLLR